MITQKLVSVEPHPYKHQPQDVDVDSSPVYVISRKTLKSTNHILKKQRMAAKLPFGAIFKEKKDTLTVPDF